MPNFMASNSRKSVERSQTFWAAPKQVEERPPTEGERPPPVQSPARVDIVVSGDCVVTVNGVSVP